MDKRLNPHYKIIFDEKIIERVITKFDMKVACLDISLFVKIGEKTITKFLHMRILKNACTKISKQHEVY